MAPRAERLLFAVTQVPGSTAACAARGDAAMFATLQAYYGLAAEAVAERATSLWHAFDERCRVQIKLGVGVLQCGPLGPPGAERFDVVGDALNTLFRAPWADFHISPEAAALVQAGGTQ